MKKFFDGTQGILLVVALLLVTGITSGVYPASAQAPTPSASDEGDPTLDPVEPVLPTPVTADIPAGNQTATGGSLAFETPEGVQPDIMPKLSPAACLQGPGEWELMTPLSTPFYGAGVVSDGIYAYVAGGNTISGAINTLTRYNPQDNSWTSLANLPTAVYDALAIYAEGKIFLLGGQIDSSTIVNLVQIYTIASNSWTTGHIMPGTRAQMSGGYDSGILIAVGGLDSAGLTPQNQTWRYSIAANSWATSAAMPAALGGAGSGMVNGHLFVIGGRDTTHTSLTTVYDYSVAGNSWSTKAPIPVGVNFPGTAVYLNRIWVFGGGDPFDGITNTQIYDPFYNTWSVGPALNSGRSFQNGVAMRNQIISIGGWGTDYSNVVEVATQPLLNVLIVYSDAGIKPTTLQFDLMAQPGIGQVDTFNGQVVTPTLADLKAYDIVVPFSNAGWANAVTLGNILADYQDSGGVVVGLAFDWNNALNNMITGRWLTDGYSPFNPTTTTAFSTVSLGTIQRTGHPLLAGVNVLSVFYHLNVTATAATVQVAAWSDGNIALAYKGRAVGINAYLGDFAGQWSGDFAAIIANAGYLLRAGSPTCVSTSCQGPTVIEGAITDTDLTQTDRIVRGDPASTCASPQSCSAFGSGDSFHYDVYPFVNNSSTTQCVSVKVDAKTCIDTHYLQSAAYLGAYNPANQCSNFLGDIGASPTPIKSYSFSVAAWQSYSVVVLNSVTGNLCPGYTVTVTPQQCDLREMFLPLIQR